MIMALHLLVNLAGFNTFPQAKMGDNGAQPTAILGDLFGKNRLNMTRQVSSPIPNPSESESQVGSVVNQKIHSQDEGSKHRKVKMTEELNEVVKTD